MFNPMYKYPVHKYKKKMSRQQKVCKVILMVFLSLLFPLLAIIGKAVDDDWLSLYKGVWET